MVGDRDTLLSQLLRSLKTFLEVSRLALVPPGLCKNRALKGKQTPWHLHLEQVLYKPGEGPVREFLMDTAGAYRKVVRTITGPWKHGDL